MMFLLHWQLQAKAKALPSAGQGKRPTCWLWCVALGVWGGRCGCGWAGGGAGGGVLFGCVGVGVGVRGTGPGTGTGASVRVREI